MDLFSDKLDLHGLRHEEASVVIEDFFYTHMPPFQIVTGNSLSMREKVIDICEIFGYECFYKHENNLGCLLIIERLK